MVSGAKRPKHENAPTSSRFKGVVLQQNGHWGAQIYANHQRIWLGTFKSKKAAAMAYDSAAIKLRSGDAHRNFPWTQLPKQEPTFQNLFSTEAILTMIKDGSYESKFAEFLNTQSPNLVNDNTLFKIDGGGVSKKQLFEKVLTPSDVGKLNRLVIPKKHAIKYFPQVPETDCDDAEDSKGGTMLLEDVKLLFFDAEMRSWKFRYCYWKSSQSFVFTRGWNRFVKDKELMANDVVSFYRCEYRQGYEVKNFCLIEVAYNREIGDENQEKDLVFELGFGGGREEKMEEEEDEKIVETPLQLPFPSLERQSLRLFGVEIIVAHKV